MSERVILDLPNELVQRAREASDRSGQPLEQVLVEWLERSAASEDVSTLVSGTEYAIYTPYGNEAAAQVLWDFLQETKTQDSKRDKES